MHFVLAFFLSNLIHFFYAPTHGAWYTGAVWGNIFVVVIVGPATWLWSRTKFWPLNPIKHHLMPLLEAAHAKLDTVLAHHEKHHADMAEMREQMRDLHAKHDALHASHVEIHAKLDRLSTQPSNTGD